METPLREGPTTTQLTLIGKGSVRAGEVRLAMEASGPVLMERCDFEIRFLNRSNPRGFVLVPLASEGVVGDADADGGRGEVGEVGGGLVRLGCSMTSQESRLWIVHRFSGSVTGLSLGFNFGLGEAVQYVNNELKG